MAANFGFKHSQSFPRNKDIQNGDPRDHSAVSTTGGVGHLAGFQRRLFPHPHSSEVQEVPQVSFEQSHLSVQGSSPWFGNGPVRVHQSGQGGKVDGSGTGYLDPPVPR